MNDTSPSPSTRSSSSEPYRNGSVAGAGREDRPSLLRPNRPAGQRAGAFGTGLPDALPEFDLTEGLQRLMGNRALYRKLLVNFATQYLQAAADIRSALDCRRLRAGPRAGPRHQGGCRQLGGQGSAAAIAALEKLVKHADPGSPPPVAELNRAYDAFRQSLGRALDAVGPLMAAAVTPEAPPAAAAGALRRRWRRRRHSPCGRRPNWGHGWLAAICSELAAKSEAFAPYAAKVVRWPMT